MPLLFALLFIGWFPSLSQAATAEYAFPNGKVTLLSERATWSKGQPIRLGLAFTLNPEWHIYWKNSGDSGTAPKWSWAVDNGKITAEAWPVPQRIPVAGLTNLAYEKQAVFRFDVTAEAADKPIVAKVKLEFLACKVECVPYFTDLEVTVPYSASNAEARPIFAGQYYPGTPLTGVTWNVKSVSPTFIVTEMTVPEEVRHDLSRLEVFPFEGDTFKASSPEMLPEGKVYELTIPLQDTKKTSFAGSRFLVVLEQGSDLDRPRHIFEMALGGADAAGASAAPVGATNFWLVFLWAIIGGLILNVMPCVFPVLSIKILSFLGPDKNAAKLKRSGIFYTVGVLVSFLALGGTLLALRAAGEKIGWGFQLQSPVIASGIAVLFFWMGLNFLGTFEIGNSLMGIGTGKGDSSPWGSFLTGVLATVVATPCTAPFMGAALGAALTMPTVQTVGIFFGLGLGMALPFLGLAFFPQFLKVLPRPGVWMQTMKEFLAFPLFATVLWLLWVLGQQIAVEGILFVLAILLMVSLWVWTSHRFREIKWRQTFLLAGFVTSFGCLTSLPKARPVTETAVSSSGTQWKKYSEAAVKAEVDAGKAVFIDFTAAWCITCQVNKKLVLNTEPIQNLLRQNNVVLFRGDWTDQDPVVTAGLASYGRNSLPLYVYYAPGAKQPQLLPEVLTPGIIENLFKKETNQ